MSSTDLPDATHRTSGSLTFLGAAGTVTGSMFLVQTPRARVLVDAGLFQGPRPLRRLNWERSFDDPRSLDAVVLTHAHLDHSGYLPVLARDGFSGDVRCSAATAALSQIVLKDAGHLQEQEAEHSAHYGYSKHPHPRPLFTQDDAARASALMCPADFDRAFPVAPGVTVRFRPAGHILGSATVELDVDGTRLLFSGDLGRPGHPLLRPPEPAPPVDAVVLESTYGDEGHEPPEDDLLARTVTRTLDRGGTCLLPTFAVDRTPMMVHTLDRLRTEGRIPSATPIYVDSPMAIRAWEVYRDALLAKDPQFRPDLDRDALEWDRHVVMAMDREASTNLNRPAVPSVIVSASGMATGGRVLHHLAAQLPDPRNSVILTGFQVPGTRGSDLASGARSLKIHGEYVPVRADVVSLRGYSAHADASQLVDWVRHCGAHTVYVVHGEPAASRALAGRVCDELDLTAVVPRHQERVRL
jgi:metallo-beta-lactamase family protein